MNRILLSALAALILFSCSKNDDPDPEPWPPEGDYNQFQIHYFVPSALKNTVVADSLFVNDVLYADKKGTGVLKSYSGLPGEADKDGTIRFFIGKNNMNIKLYKDKSLIYNQQAGNLQTGGIYHLVVYDLDKPPVVFTRVNQEEAYEPFIRIKFANILFQNPTTKFPGTVRLQYAYQDEDDWQTVDKALKFGEATETFRISKSDPYKYIQLRVVDQDGCVLTSGDDGVEIAMVIVPENGNNFENYVFIVGGNLEGGQPAELFQWKSF